MNFLSKFLSNLVLVIATITVIVIGIAFPTLLYHLIFEVTTAGELIVTLSVGLVITITALVTSMEHWN